MGRKSTQTFQSRNGLLYLCLVLFAAATAFYSVPLAVVEGIIILIAYVYHSRSHNQRRREITRYMETVTGSMDTATKDAMVNSPLPMVMFRLENGEIIWSNERFLQLCGEREHLFDAKLSAIAPDFDTRWMMEGKSQSPTEVVLGDKRFLVFGHLVHTAGKNRSGYLATTYWVDISDFCAIREQYQKSRPVVAVFLLDNYDDLMKNLSENERSAIYTELNGRLAKWIEGTGGMFRKTERERYLFIFEEQHLSRFIEQKFDILDTVHEVKNPSGISATLSMGIGKDGETFQQLLQFANLSIEMALSRGGDQAVIRNQFTFEFYGGHSTETEKRTKVKSRVMASALSALLTDSSKIFVMGHKQPDMDCVGAAVGVCAIARKLGVPAYIIKASGPNPAKTMTDKLQQVPEYQDCFITAQEALVAADTRSLAVVVDTNRPEQVQALDLLNSCNRIAVIDHHRRAATYIEGAALNFHETYASSACELVTELLQYIMEPADLLRIEAECLLGGIVLDTKNFTMRTGGRTFEAAAFLRRSGADTGDVKRLFQNDLAGTIEKYSIIQNAKLYRDEIAIAVSDHPVGRVIAAQSADELLNIIGIQTSFVLFPDVEGRIVISARSMNKTNVQVILEQLGGGGNAATAGAQVVGMTLEEAARELMQAIDRYLAE